MEKTLFVNACVRPQSRTRLLARYVLDRLGGPVEEVDLERENIQPLNWKTLQLREGGEGENGPMLRYARQFARADVIVIAAPYWDLSFPASVKAYIEAVSAIGVTFRYTPEGRPEGLCRARKLIYVTTAGGRIGEINYGFHYVRELARQFYGIRDAVCFQAEELDVDGADVDAILDRARAEIQNSPL